jgi:hypothetical protein
MLQFEQQANIKFCQKLRKSPRETFNMMQQVYGEETSGCSATFKRHQCFAQGRDSLLNESSGQPKAVGTERRVKDISTLVRANNSRLVDDITAAVWLSYGTCHIILTDDLNMSRVSEHCVPCILMQDQCDDRMTTCGDLISNADED